MKTLETFVWFCLLCKGYSRRSPAAQKSNPHGKNLANLFLSAHPSAALTTRATSHPLRTAGERASSPVMKAGTTARAPWNPFVNRPSYLDGTLAADAGFDPLGLVTLDGPWWKIAEMRDPKRRVAWMREAEIKHARLAMLATAGWPLSELYHGRLSSLLGLPFELDATQGRAPSVLNGNLGEATPILIGFLLLSIFLEIKTLDQQYGLTATGKTISSKSNQLVMKSYTPGDVGFDPLGLYYWRANFDPSKDVVMKWQDPDAQFDWFADKRQFMEAAEIRNGRLAMLAITGFAIQEALFKVPIVDQTPEFFDFQSGFATIFH